MARTVKLARRSERLASCGGNRECQESVQSFHVLKTISFCLMCGFGATVLLAQPAAPTYTISTAVGNGTAGFAGDGGSATSAELHLPSGVAFSGGNLYVVDQVNNRVRLVSGGNIKT